MSKQLVPLPAAICVLPRGQWDRRRCEQRYHCGPATLGNVFTAAAPHFCLGWVVDLSTRGAGLLLAHPLDRDMLFVLHLKSTLERRLYELPGRVMHSTTQVSGDWLIGCEFADPLTPDDLDALL